MNLSKNFVFFIYLLSYYTCLANNPLLLVSLDGFRADKLDEFLRNNPESFFGKIVANGLKADYMIPSFPSSTFANHFTLVTGD